MLPNWWELDYRRLFRAWQGQLDFTAEVAGAQDFLTQGWYTNTVTAWDISNPLRPKLLTGAAITPDGSQFDVRFGANPAAGDRFWLQDTTTFAAPASLRIRPPTGLRTPPDGADAVIVTHSSLLSAANTLAAWHAAHGRRAPGGGYSRRIR